LIFNFLLKITRRIPVADIAGDNEYVFYVLNLIKVTLSSQLTFTYVHFFLRLIGISNIGLHFKYNKKADIYKKRTVYLRTSEITLRYIGTFGAA
jgi:hypothetical protein